MPRATIGDTSLTRSYIPKVSQTPGISPSIAHFYKPIKNRHVHEGRVIDQLYYTSDHIDRCFSNIRLNCLYKINEPIVPRFVLDYHSQVTLQRDDSIIILISFMIQNEFITLWIRIFKKRNKKESQTQTNPSTGRKGPREIQVKSKSKVIRSKKIQLEGLKLPSLKLYYKRLKDKGQKCTSGRDCIQVI
ncbi:hypothetical protein Tco_0910437 [Tanacetum coccineum]|uniref:Uncharacterized protein n=1 Tax=Tanacetum coccineum TaxID=301880 RepID=A0ABQ5CUJ1_9ASTR